MTITLKAAHYKSTVLSAGCSNKHDMTALPAAAPITSSKVNTSPINFHKLWWDRDKIPLTETHNKQEASEASRVTQRRKRRKNKGTSARNNMEQSRRQTEEQSASILLPSPGLLTSLRSSGESSVVVVVVETVGL